MILYKTIAMQYSRFLKTGQANDDLDPVGVFQPTEETRQQRHGIVEDIAAARVYLLDHRAANYLDSLRMDVQGMPWEQRPEEELRRYLSEIEFPRDIVWVELDERQLWEDRIARGLTTMSRDNLDTRRQLGFLFDNRSDSEMTVRMFSALSDRAFMDSSITLTLAKTQDGRPCFDNAGWVPQENVLNALLQATGSDDTERYVVENVNTQKGHLSYEMVIGFLLFAALAAREDDLITGEAPGHTAAQVKTARKFGKSWITETARSHVTVRIGPAGERHLTEHKARKDFEDAKATGRATPTEHWVAEHERHYKSGKIVRIRAYKRGKPADRNIPVRVVGPSSTV